jgi:hypothetical protein
MAAVTVDLVPLQLKDKQTNKNKLCDPYSASELYGLSDRHLLAKFIANFCG